VGGNVGEVRTALAAINDRDFDDTGGFEFFGTHRTLRSQARANEVFHFILPAQARVEIDEHGDVRGMQVENTANAFESAGEEAYCKVGLGRKGFRERYQQGAVAGGQNSWRAAHLS
jgi:hypothetical protein